MFKNSTHLVQNVQGLQDENRELKRQLEQMMIQAASSMQKELGSQVEVINGVKTVIKKLDLSDMNAAKTLAHNLEQEMVSLLFVSVSIKAKRLIYYC